VELQRRHRHQRPGEYLCGERQAIRRGAGRLAAAEQHHPAGSSALPRADDVLIQKMSPCLSVRHDTPALAESRPIDLRAAGPRALIDRRDHWRRGLEDAAEMISRSFGVKRLRSIGGGEPCGFLRKTSRSLKPCFRRHAEASGCPFAAGVLGVDVHKCPCLCAPVYWTFVGHQTQRTP
jgi:hypothetical protein